MELQSKAGSQSPSKSRLIVEVVIPITPRNLTRKNTTPISPMKLEKNASPAVATPSRKRPRIFASTTPTSSHALTVESPTKAKKIKLQATYTTESPFPNHLHPTAEEAVEVHEILTKAHQPVVRRPPQHTSNSAQTCGNVPNVIEAIIGTILSQNTTQAICARAKANLDQAFGRNDFEAMASAPKQKVVDAIRAGGLANKKAGMIQGLLHAVKEKHGSYSLQHLTEQGADSKPVFRDDEIMAELLSYNGVGPKTASCVLMFCIGRDSFAVDTHIYRLSRLLGWIPPKANRVTAQAHLDLRVPNELKYGLHMLMFQHGRECKGCKQAGAREDCPLKTYLKEGKKIKDDDLDIKLEEAEHEIKMED